MSHSLRTDVDLKPHPEVPVPPQAVFQLDGTDDLVALSIGTVPTATALAFKAAAWLVDAQGDPQGVLGVPVLRQFPHTADVAQLNALGVQGIAAALRDLLLGDMPSLPPAPLPRWGEQLRAEVSIRNAIAIARAAGELIDFGS